MQENDKNAALAKAEHKAALAAQFALQEKTIALQETAMALQERTMALEDAQAEASKDRALSRQEKQVSGEPVIIDYCNSARANILAALR